MTFLSAICFLCLLVANTLAPATAAFSDINLANFPSGSQGFKIFGQTANTYLGNTVIGAGDFNDDGVGDLVLSVHSDTVLSRAASGSVYVIFGKAGPSPFPSIRASNFTTSATTGFRVYGAAAGDNLQGVAGIGDYNNDGIDDIALGAPNADPAGRNGAGTVYVIYGRTTGIADIDLLTFTTSATNGFKIISERAGDALGIFITKLGDFNGDGLPDFATLEANGDRIAGDNARLAVVIFGKAGRSTDIDLLSLSFSDGFRIYSWGEQWPIPYAIGDINNDGYDDIAVTFPGYDIIPGRVDCGCLTVYFGHTAAMYAFGNLRMDQFAAGTIGFKVLGAVAYDAIAQSAGRAGDFNNDGLNDFYVGANGGKGYIIFGRKGVTSYEDMDLLTYLDTPNRGQLLLPSTNLGNGWRWSGTLGDFNGDGISDVFFSVPSYQSNKGVVVVLFGHRNTTASFAPLAYDTMSAGALGFRIFGAEVNDYSGSDASSAGDLNGDGVADLAIGVPNSDPYGIVNAGTVYVIYGQGPPTRAPTASPTARPTTPTSQPSSQPSTQPSVNPETMQSILASPTYKVRNGFAFAAVGAGGEVSAWGEAQYGGDASAVLSQLQSGVAAVVGSRFALAAVKDDGSFALWGVNVSISGLARYGSLSYSVTSLVGNEAAFAGVDTATGRVIAVGSKHHGGNVLDDAYCNGYSAHLSAGVSSIAASAGAFAAIKTDNTLLCWGNEHAGADIAAGALSALVGAKLVVATMAAFAVLLSDNTVASWGDRLTGGDSSAVASQLREVHHLTASRSCFVAFKKSSGVVVWGYHEYGGDTSAVAAALSSHVVQVAHTFTAMAVLKEDGTVVAWGDASAGGDESAVQASLQDITRIYANGKAFAALNSTGGVVAWGAAAKGGSIPSDKVSALSSGVVSIAHTDRAFAALKGDGSVVVWGQAGQGGSPGTAVEALLTSGVHTICANDVAFSAIKTDGSVVAWGHSVSVPTAGVQFTSSSLAAGAQCA